MHELVPKTRIEGNVLLRGEDLYSAAVDPAIVRRRVGMIFQKSNPFPTMTIGENVVIGLRLNGVRNQRFLNDDSKNRSEWLLCGTKSRMIYISRARVFQVVSNRGSASHARSP